MKPPKDSRMADEKAAVDLQRKKPSWRATRAVNTASATSLRAGVTVFMWAAIGVVAVLLLIGWLVHIR